MITKIKQCETCEIYGEHSCTGIVTIDKKADHNLNCEDYTPMDAQIVDPEAIERRFGING